jgi:DNA-binding protein H-NS
MSEENPIAYTNPSLDDLLAGYNTQQLLEAKEKVAAAIQAKVEQDSLALKENIEAIAKATGATVEKVVELLVPNVRRVAKPKYRHPENADLTWGGRGKTPNWLEEAFEKHGEQACLAD